MSEAIHIYHTNDLHSHFEKWPRIEAFLRSRQQLHAETGEKCLILDIGDHVDRWHPYTEGTHGKGNIELLNEAGYQYVTIGNNEGITMTYDDLDSLYEKADFKVLAANIYQQNGERPKWALPYDIHTTTSGTRIAMLGLTANFQKLYSALGWKVSEPFIELEQQLSALKSKADIIVLLSHLGIHDDERIAADFPMVDVILGAHTHHILHHGKVVNQSLLCGAGKYGFYVGQVELTVNEIGEVIDKKAWLYDTNEFNEIEGESKWEQSLHDVGSRALQEVVATLPEALETQWFTPSILPDILCKALREWSSADCAFLNAGLLLEGLPKGKVTKADLHRILPHPINPCVVSLSGSQLKEIIMQSLNPEWPHMPVKGFGFRGKIMGNMVYDKIDFIKTNNGLVKYILIDGEKLNPEKQYKLVLPDMFTFGYFFPHLQRSQHKEYLMPEFLRDILAWKLKTD